MSNFLARHPNQPYIAFYDIPKVHALNNQWVAEGPHIMIIVADPAQLELRTCASTLWPSVRRG
jgi:hypothetical protein